MIKKIAIGIAVVIAAVLIFAATRPDTFRIERSASIKAPPEKIFPHINDLRTWGEWSPWEKIDPDMKRTFSGSESGLGAAYAWEGNSEVGKGRMEITESTPPSKVVLKLDFLFPMESLNNYAEFTLVPSGESTTVTWAMRGPNSYFSKLIGLFLSMDGMVGGMFEKGLTNLKAAAER